MVIDLWPFPTKKGTDKYEAILRATQDDGSYCSESLAESWAAIRDHALPAPE